MIYIHIIQGVPQVRHMGGGGVIEILEIDNIPGKRLVVKFKTQLKIYIF